MSPLRGERRDRPTYQILDRLTSGRGDDVFLAHHEIFDGKFVQKTVSMHGLEDALASNEPAFLNRLDHPRIVPIREAQWDPDEERAITFVMPHFEGGSVHDALLEDYRFSVGEAMAVSIDALDALEYVHREFRAIHRDTKPGNVLLNADRTCGYLSDFGSAATIGPDGCASTVLGTNVYRPPESRIVGRIGIPCDLYGIGVMLFEMLNGRIAWEELDLSAVEARLARGLRAVPDSAFRFHPQVPDRLRRVVRKALARDPAGRFASAAEFIRALRKVDSMDWRHTDGVHLEGEWFGSWPARLRPNRRTDYRVTSRVLRAGASAGRLRLEADCRRPGGGWRQAVADSTVAMDDITGVDAYFVAVAASAAHRSPAR